MTKSITFECNLHFERSGRGSRKTIREGEAKELTPQISGRVPRVARLMALAIRFDQLIQAGDVADCAACRPPGPRHPSADYPDHESAAPGPRHPGGDPLSPAHRERPRYALSLPTPANRPRSGLAETTKNVAETAHRSSYLASFETELIWAHFP